MSLEGLKPNDKVVLFQGSLGSQSIHFVAWIMKRQVIIYVNGKELKFSKKTGRILGTREWNWNHNWRIEPATKEYLAILEEDSRRQFLLSRVRAIDWRSVSNEDYETILQIVEKN